MDTIQFTIIEERLKRIESLLLNIQPKQRIKKVKVIDERPLEEQLVEFQNKYSPLMIKKFLMYWTEKDRWKKEKVFDVSMRLERWKMQEEQWDYEKSQKKVKIDEMPKYQEFKELRIDGSFEPINNMFDKYKV